MEAIKAYLERIKNLPVLTKKEEIEYIRKAKRGSRVSRRKIINCNLKLVVSIAKHYSNYNFSLMDLIAEGQIMAPTGTVAMVAPGCSDRRSAAPHARS